MPATAPPPRTQTDRGRPLAVGDVSRLTGLSVGTLRNWKCQGTGPRCVKLGRRVVYFESDVSAWIDANAIETH